MTSFRRASVAALALLSSACWAGTQSPSDELRLRHVVLYQNGIGYFERSGVMQSDRLRLSFREREIDDVLKSFVVVEDDPAARGKPSTVSARLPQAKQKASSDPEDVTWLDVMLSPRTPNRLSVAYAVPTAAWKSTYRVILPDPSGPRKDRALLQAWALVDNVSDEDWDRVTLTLATGAPMSFVSDLRSPRFVARPDAQGHLVDPTATGPVYAERSGAGDRDADGILDVDDRCPDEVEDRDQMDDQDGCPDLDDDRDGIEDARDACPREPGAPSTEAARNGCPTMVRRVLSSSEIRILQQLRFGRSSDALAAGSGAVLDEIARVLKANPRIGAITIEGHTSDDEKDPWALAARRAAAVRAALLQRGVTTDLRVTAFGETRPIAANDTDDGRSRNRRVELRVTETAPEGGASPTTAPPRGSGVVDAASAARAPRSAAAPRDVAGSIRYDITNPISIPRRSSTLVTIVNDPMPGEDVYLFRPDPAAPGSERHPMRAARLQLEGDVGLQPGSVAIFAGGTFVGEGLIERLNPRETAMIPYAIDSSTTVTAAAESTERPVRLLAIARGVMTVENVGVNRTRYEIAVGQQAPARVFVRHPKSAGFTAQALPPGTDSGPDAHLVPIPITPGRKSVLTIEEHQPRRAQIAVLDPEGARLGLYLAESSLPPELHRQIKALIALRSELVQLDEAIAALAQQLGDNAQRTTELRESLRAVERTPRANPIQSKLMERLAQATATGEALAAKLAEKRAAHAETRAQLVEGLRDVRLEETPK